MASSFKGWGSSWGNSWGPVQSGSGAMAGAAGFVFTPTAQAVALLFAQGSGSISVTAVGTLAAGVINNDMAGATSFAIRATGALSDPYAFIRTILQDTSQGKAAPAQRDYYVENLNRQFERKSRLQREDVLATEFIAALLQMEMLDG